MRDAPEIEEARRDAEFVEEYLITQFEASHYVRLGLLNKLRRSPRANLTQKRVDVWVNRFIDQLLQDRKTEK